MTIDNKIDNIKEIPAEKFDFITEFEQPIVEYEEKQVLKNQLQKEF